MIEPVPPSVAVSAFYAVLVGLDQTGRPFADAVERRMLLYPTNAYGPDAEQLGALVTAARRVGDSDAFLSTVAPGDAGGEHFALRPFDGDAYEDPALGGARLSPHALYSPRAAWGVLCTLEQEAYTGGTAEFVDALVARLPRSPAQMAADWLEALAAVQHRYPERQLGAWGRRQLAHLFGPAEAERLAASSPLAPAP